MTRDREKDRERLRRVTSPERQRHQPAQSRANGASIVESRPARDGPLPSSGDATRHLQSSVVSENSDKGMAESANDLQRMPTRRGIWEWAKVWKGPTHSMNMTVSSIDGMLLESGTMSESQDDFSIPSTITSQVLDSEQRAEVAADRMEGFGISSGMSPSFSQTKRSSDELVAASSTSSTPANRNAQSESWSNSNDETSTPSAASKDSPPSTPDTPTPQPRRRDTPASGNASMQSSTSKDVSSATKPESHEKKSNGKSKPKPSPSDGTPSPRHIPTYKIALAPNLLSPARNEVASK